MQPYNCGAQLSHIGSHSECAVKIFGRTKPTAFPFVSNSATFSYKPRRKSIIRRPGIRHRPPKSSRTIRIPGAPETLRRRHSTVRSDAAAARPGDEHFSSTRGPRGGRPQNTRAGAAREKRLRAKRRRKIARRPRPETAEKTRPPSREQQLSLIHISEPTRPY